MEKIIDENKQGQSLVLDQHKNNTRKLFIESCVRSYMPSNQLLK